MPGVKWAPVSNSADNRPVGQREAAAGPQPTGRHAPKPVGQAVPSAAAMSTFAVSIGIAKPRPSAFADVAVVTPMTAPVASMSGPPLLPGLIAASVWIEARQAGQGAR